MERFNIGYETATDREVQYTSAWYDTLESLQAEIERCVGSNNWDFILITRQQVPSGPGGKRALAHGGRLRIPTRKKESA